MKKTEPAEVSIDALEQDGCGYSADRKQAVFGSLPGERVIATPVSKRRGRLYLRTTEVLSASKGRVDPVCSAAAFCGGCSYQHLAHDAPLTLEHAALVEALRERLRPGDAILIKGSRGSHMERIVEALRAEVM